MEIQVSFYHNFTIPLRPSSLTAIWFARNALVSPQLALLCPRLGPSVMNDMTHDVEQLEEVIMDGWIGSITPFKSVYVPIRTSGPTFPSTTPRNCSKRRD